MEPHVVRLLIEQEQLEEKLSKLEAVFKSTLFDSFEENMKSLLLIQFHAMKTYRECLEQRIKILK